MAELDGMLKEAKRQLAMASSPVEKGQLAEPEEEDSTAGLAEKGQMLMMDLMMASKKQLAKAEAHESLAEKGQMADKRSRTGQPGRSLAEANGMVLLELAEMEARLSAKIDRAAKEQNEKLDRIFALLEDKKKL